MAGLVAAAHGNPATTMHTVKCYFNCVSRKIRHKVGHFGWLWLFWWTFWMDGSRLALLIIFEPHKKWRLLKTELWDFTEVCAWQPLGFGYSAGYIFVVHLFAKQTARDKRGRGTFLSQRDFRACSEICLFSAQILFSQQFRAVIIWAMAFW